MRDRDLYSRILGLQSPWRVSEVELALGQGQVRVHAELEADAPRVCPQCAQVVPGYDTRRRQWRHLDTCQCQTILVAEVPRVQCPEHGVVTMRVPWAEPGAGFTALFEALVIDWLREASVSAVARQLQLSWNAIDGIMRRAVDRGLHRRDTGAVCKRLGVDETSFRKRHDYVTVVTDQDRGCVLHVADDRTKASLEAYYHGLTKKQRAAIESIAMDMWEAYIQATVAQIPEAGRKIAFDKFHVAQYLGEAVDKVRRHEHKVLLKAHDESLKGTKYLWLTKGGNLSAKQRRVFTPLRDSKLTTARAWAIKEEGMSLWQYRSRTWAEKGWRRWYGWAIRSRLEPVKAVARMIKEHLWGILNAVILRATNGPAESINSRIKTLKIRSRGFRNKERFKTAIYFHLGGLNLYPAGVK